MMNLSSNVDIVYCLLFRSGMTMMRQDKTKPKKEYFHTQNCVSIEYIQGHSENLDTNH